MKSSVKKILLILFFNLIFVPLFADAYYICVGSFQKKTNAQNLAYSLTADGTPSYIFQAETKKGTFYRVLLVESFKKLGDADAKKNSFLKSSSAKKYKISSAWILNMRSSVKDVPVLQQPESLQLVDDEDIQVIDHVEKNEKKTSTVKEDKKEKSTAKDKPTQTKTSEPKKEVKKEEPKKEPVIIEEKEEAIILEETVQPKEEVQKTVVEIPEVKEEPKVIEEPEVKQEIVKEKEESKLIEEPEVKQEPVEVKEEPEVIEEPEVKQEIVEVKEEPKEEEKAIEETEVKQEETEAKEETPVEKTETAESEKADTTEEEQPKSEEPAEKQIVPLKPFRLSFYDSSKVSLSLTPNESGIQFNQDAPFAVKVASFSEQSRAQKNLQNINMQDVSSYLVKTYSDDKYFNFDICTGAFATQEEAENLKKELVQKGLVNSEVVSYLNLKDKIENYNKVVAENKVEFKAEKTNIPSSVSQNVKDCMNLFPVSENAEITHLYIYDYYNLRNTGNAIEDYYELDDFVVYGYRSKAAILSVYKDDLLNSTVSIYMEKNDEPLFEEYGLPAGDSIEFSSKGQLYSCVIYQDGDKIKMTGKNMDNKILIRASATGCDKNAFINFLDDSFNDINLIENEHVRKSFLTIPEENPEVPKSFVSFALNNVDKEYAQEKAFSGWLDSTFGRWHTNVIYNQNGNNFNIDYYDFDYDYNANKVYEVFKKEKNQETEELFDDPYSHTSALEKGKGWYLSGWNANEISFLSKSYIIIASSKNLNEDELKVICNAIQVWSDSDANAK